MKNKTLNSILITGALILSGFGIYMIIKRFKKTKISNIPNAEKYKKYGSNPIEVALELEPLAYGQYKWTSTSGMPIDIYFKGDKPLFEKTKDGSTYCTGFTFTVFYICALNRGLLNNFTNADIKKLQSTWNEGEPSQKPKLCVDAISKSVSANLPPLGKEVSLESAQKGDFCQIWRANSGHSVILVEKITKENKIVGFKYYSSNSGINQKTKRSGAGYGTEYFSDSGGKMLRDKTYFARLNN